MIQSIVPLRQAGSRRLRFKKFFGLIGTVVWLKSKTSPHERFSKNSIADVSAGDMFPCRSHPVAGSLPCPYPMTGSLQHLHTAGGPLRPHRVWGRGRGHVSPVGTSTMLFLSINSWWTIFAISSCNNTILILELFHTLKNVFQLNPH